MAALGAKQLPAAVNNTRLLARIQASDHVGADLGFLNGYGPQGAYNILRRKLFIDLRGSIKLVRRTKCIRENDSQS